MGQRHALQSYKDHQSENQRTTLIALFLAMESSLAGITLPKHLLVPPSLHKHTLFTYFSPPSQTDTTRSCQREVAGGASRVLFQGIRRAQVSPDHHLPIDSLRRHPSLTLTGTPDPLGCLPGRCLQIRAPVCESQTFTGVAKETIDDMFGELTFPTTISALCRLLWGFVLQEREIGSLSLYWKHICKPVTFYGE